MKGIILAGGSGTRLHPLTRVISKQLLPIYDKPMIQYPLSVLMLAGIRDILIISTPIDLPFFEKFLGNGSDIGINLSYKEQKNPNGIAEAFIIGEDFIGNDSVCLILGDNIFYSHELSLFLKKSVETVEENGGSVVIGYRVKDPQRYGVVEFDKNNCAISLEEKPIQPKSNYVVVGLYFYDNEVINISKTITPSKRGELEITDVNKEYLNRKKLFVKKMGRGFAWLDTGTHDSLMDASNFVRVIEDRQGFKVACIEEIAWRNGWISDEQLGLLSKKLSKSQYGEYMIEILSECC